jgi:hypothetical protein
MIRNELNIGKDEMKTTGRFQKKCGGNGKIPGKIFV